jgi:hypothetical protein
VSPRATALCLIALCLASVSSSANADDVVEDAWRLYLSADFEGALAAFDQAETGALERRDLLRILEGRAQIHFALGDSEAVRGALARLASLSPDYRLSPETPPDLVEAFGTIRDDTPLLRLEVTPQREEGLVRFRASAIGDVGGLVRGLRITARAEGSSWVQAIDEPLTIDATSDEAIEYYVEAIGPGGAVLAALGTDARPRRLTGDASGLSPETTGGPPLGIPIWGWVAIGGSVVLVAVLVGVIAATAGGSSTQPEAPVLP